MDENFNNTPDENINHADMSENEKEVQETNVITEQEDHSVVEVQNTQNFSEHQQSQSSEDMNYAYNTGYNPNYNNQEPDESVMTMGDWVLTILALMIPCAGIILYFVWAFGKHGNVNRKNYCRAYLIIMGVLLVIYLFFFLIFGAAFISSMN
ncbi:hypothetical protein ACTQ6A_06980 [Lachnospiraceae bacterium LCP25S3_G4]